MKRKRMSLDELSCILPVLSKIEQRMCVGGGTGTREDPYTYEDYCDLLIRGQFYGGWMDWGGYMLPIEVTVYGNSYSFGYGNSYSYIDYYGWGSSYNWDFRPYISWGNGQYGPYGFGYGPYYGRDPYRLSGDSMFNISVDFVFRCEGVYSNDKDDRGGPTKYGITERFLYDYGNIPGGRPHSIMNLTEGQARAIYNNYWDSAPFKDIKDHNIAKILFDSAVNQGSDAAWDGMQRVLGRMGMQVNEGQSFHITIEAINKCDTSRLFTLFKEERIQMYNRTIEKNSSQEKYRYGWYNRVNAFIYM